jgi:hypothetical protein
MDEFVMREELTAGDTVAGLFTVVSVMSLQPDDSQLPYCRS